MLDDSSSPRKAQLDKAEREQLEEVVVELRDTVEAEIEYTLENRYNLSDRDPDVGIAEDDQETRAQLVEAIDREDTGDRSWEECFERYITGVGYTLVNRIAALRCMEVRGFIDYPITQIGESGRTPAAERLLTQRFDLGPDDALVEAYHEECERLDEEIELLFDTDSPYSVVDPDPDTFEDLITLLDSVPEEVWRADDVLGWVYEYYNVKLLDDLRRKGDREGLEPEDVPPANQFYTPHWVVRMLTDNSLGKLYLEDTGELQAVVEAQEALSPDERKNRPLSPDESPDLADFCTYLVPSEEEGEPTDFDGPEDLRVIDPACGSGHFLLYAFDVLERIWRAESEVSHAEIPREILRHNLYGVDLDMRACQLAAFNLYLKARTRTEAEGEDGFEMPDVGIVCADAKVADIEGVEEVFDEVAGGRDDIEAALRRILDAFEEVHGLGSLLDVRGTLGELFEDGAEDGLMQITLGDDPRENLSLGQVLHSLRKAVDERRNGDSFLAQDLRSFVRLLDVLAQDYDVALMNPPYGSKNRMPASVHEYVKQHYQYSPEFYIGFFEVCDRLVKTDGRTGMLVPRSFMFKNQYIDFRSDFVGERGSFDFLAEYGIGVLDNATVRTVGTVMRSGIEQDEEGSFIRLHDLDAEEKEEAFMKLISGHESSVPRFFEVRMSEFENIPRKPICYSTPPEVRELHQQALKIDTDQANIEGKSACHTAPGLQTADNSRFIRYLWETDGIEQFEPIAKGGADAWIVPPIKETIGWQKDGQVMMQANREAWTRNKHLYGQDGLAWTYIKDTGRRFGFYPGGLFSHTSLMLFPRNDNSLWRMMAILNSSLYHALFLSLTTERHWNAGEVGSVPWLEKLEDVGELERLAKGQYETVLCQRFHNPTSPYYIEPELSPESDRATEFLYDHPHISTTAREVGVQMVQPEPTSSIREAAKENYKNKLCRRQKLEDLSEQIDYYIYEKIGISDETRENVCTEIFLRTAEDPEDREVPDPESVPEIPENLDEQVKDLVHHFALEIVREAEDGIVPLDSTAEQPTMLDRIVERFHEAYGKHAEDRLVEVDEILGTASAAEEAYPNLRRFVAEDLFAYHVGTMENTPILWKFDTARLSSDAEESGFACFVDYHSLDSGTFDRISAQYLEGRKEELRQRRGAADQRRNNDALSGEERAEATETFNRMVDVLRQIERFEGAIRELAGRHPREWTEENQEQAKSLAPKAAEFREKTQQRLDVLDGLADDHGADWFEDTFSPSFHEKVEENREEWIDALEDLEAACEAYGKPATESVEAHLADLFSYFERLAGSTHYSSNGILFATYYYEKAGSDFLDENGQPRDGLGDDGQRLAELAVGLEEYIELAEEIEADCDALDSDIPSDWKDRALSEVMTTGYRPNHKHGVAINIEPLAEVEIVPRIVEDKVL